MSTKIVLKHSATSSKVPLPTDLSPGEVAINSADVKAYIKDSTGNVVQLAGTGSGDGDYVQIIGDVMTGQLGLPGGGGNTEALQKQEIEALIEAGGASVDVSETPPGNPSEGDLWWDSSTDSGQLYIYYVDADSSQWVEASPSSGGGEADTPNLQAVTDEGNTTTNGAAFGGSVDALYLVTRAGGGGTPDSGWTALDVQGSDGSSNAGITADGSATLAGDVKIGTTGSFTPSNPAITLDASDGGILTEGYVEVRSPNNNSNAFQVFNPDNSRPVEIRNNGSATFSPGTGQVVIGDDGYFRNSRGGEYCWMNADISSVGAVAFGTAPVNDASNPTFYVKHDGSIASNGEAQFAGSVSIGGTSAANVISEYEEGQWTPTLGGDSTFDIQWGKYVKIGTFVQCWGGLRPTNVGTGNARQIQGLPFQTFSINGGTDQGGGSIVWGDGAAVDYVSAVISATLNSTVADVNVKTGASKVTQADTDFWTNGNRSNFYICYFTQS